MKNLCITVCTGILLAIGSAAASAKDTNPVYMPKEYRDKVEKMQKDHQKKLKKSEEESLGTKPQTEDQQEKDTKNIEKPKDNRKPKTSN